MINIYQLRNYAKKFLKENYDMELEIPIELNGRMSKTCGWFRRVMQDGASKPLNIELNRYFVENNDKKLVLDVLRHELVHYALHEKKKPYYDGDSYFENELRKLNIVSQSTINKYSINSKPANYNIYVCNHCEHEFQLKMALSNDGKSHKCTCGGSLTSQGKKLLSK